MAPVRSKTAKVRVLHCLEGNVERTCREIAQILNLSEASVASGIRALVRLNAIEPCGLGYRQNGITIGARPTIWRLKPNPPES